MTLPARRIVSLVPSLTETVCDLGVACRLVGITRFCVAPEEPLRFVPRVGGTKNPDLELVARLDPELVLVNGEENRREDIAWLRARFPTYESLPQSVPSAGAVVRELGRRLGVLEEAETVLLEIEAQVLRAEVEGLGRRPVRVFYPIWRQPWIGINRTTYVHDVLVRAGGINVCAEREARYPMIARDHLAALGAEVVLLPSEPFAFNARHRDELLHDQTFGRDVSILLVDGKNFCWHGSRTGRGLGYAVNLLRTFRRRVA